jgi:hypothetical protein
VKRWIKFIALVVVVLAVCIISPIVLMVTGLIVGHLLANKSPPPIAEGIVLNVSKSNDALTAVLERRFGRGTKEETLRSSLLEQGFKSLPPPPSDCVPIGKSAPIGTVFIACYDTKNFLQYEWSGFICRNTISITWQTNDQAEVTEVKGFYRSAYL